MKRLLALALLAAALPAAAELEPVAVPPSTPVPALAWTPQATPASDQRLIELILRAPEWRARKDAMRTALNTAYDRLYSSADDPAELKNLILDVWKFAVGIEATQDVIASRMSARVAAEEADPVERDRRAAAVWAVRDFRRFTLYGDLIPRVIDELHQDSRGLPDGRTYAGDTWGIAMTHEEAEAADDLLVSRTGFTTAEYKAASKAAYDEYWAAHPNKHVTPGP